MSQNQLSQQKPRPTPSVEETSIVDIADRITRQSSEPEDIDLAAEATESAPAKSLTPQGRTTKRTEPGRNSK